MPGPRARLAPSNYRRAEGADDGDDHLSEQEFAGFPLRYEDFRIAGIFPNELDWSPAARVLYRRPRSLRLDIFSRWTFIPAAVGVTTIVCVYVHTALFSGA